MNTVTIPSPRHRGEGVKGPRAYDYEELIKRDKGSLEIFWLRDESLSDSVNLPAPEVIAAEAAGWLAVLLMCLMHAYAWLLQRISLMDWLSHRPINC